MMETIENSTEISTSYTIDIFEITLDEWYEVVVKINWIILILAVIIVGLTVWGIRYFFKKKVKRKITLDGMSFGIGDFKCNLKCGNEVQEIAYHLWIELTTRKIAIPLTDDDVIVEVYDSWYLSFKSIREQLKIVPGVCLDDAAELIDVTTKVLNEGLRPHLTKWQAKFRAWYEQEKKESADSPQDIQKRFPEYDALLADIKRTNDNMINFANKLKEIAFGK